LREPIGTSTKTVASTRPVYGRMMWAMLGLRFGVPVALAAAALGALVVPAPARLGGADRLEVPHDAVTTLTGPSFAAGFPRSTAVAAVRSVPATSTGTGATT
jgi:hypothetical protein